MAWQGRFRVFSVLSTQPRGRRNIAERGESRLHDRGPLFKTPVKIMAVSCIERCSVASKSAIGVAAHALYGLRSSRIEEADGLTAFLTKFRRRHHGRRRSTN